jgi:hypothetical protein
MQARALLPLMHRVWLQANIIIAYRQKVAH